MSKEIESKDATDFWPVRQNVRGETIPNTVTKEEIREMMFSAVKNSETTDQDAIVYDQFSQARIDQTGVESIRIIQDGQVRTAFPTSGPPVWKYVSEGNAGWRK